MATGRARPYPGRDSLRDQGLDARTGPRVRDDDVAAYDMTWTFLARRKPAPDPLATLRLQIRLGELATELRRIEEDTDLYARAHHWLAVQSAYDALLREACRLADLPAEATPLRAGGHAGAGERLREELELSARGWSW